MTPSEALVKYNAARERVLRFKSEIPKAKADVQLACARVDDLERGLKRARAELVEASNELPKAVHCDVAGILGKLDAEAEAAQ